MSSYPTEVFQSLAQEYSPSAMRSIRDGANQHFELAMEAARQVENIDERLKAYRTAMAFNDLALACARVIAMGKSK